MGMSTLSNTPGERGAAAPDTSLPLCEGPHLLPALLGRTGTLGCPPRLPGPLSRAAPDVDSQYAAARAPLQAGAVSYRVRGGIHASRGGRCATPPETPLARRRRYAAPPRSPPGSPWTLAAGGRSATCAVSSTSLLRARRAQARRATRTGSPGCTAARLSAAGLP